MQQPNAPAKHTVSAPTWAERCTGGWLVEARPTAPEAVSSAVGCLADVLACRVVVLLKAAAPRGPKKAPKQRPGMPQVHDGAWCKGPRRGWERIGAYRNPTATLGTAPCSLRRSRTLQGGEVRRLLILAHSHAQTPPSRELAGETGVEGFPGARRARLHDGADCPARRPLARKWTTPAACGVADYPTFWQHSVGPDVEIVPVSPSPPRAPICCAFRDVLRLRLLHASSLHHRGSPSSRREQKQITQGKGGRQTHETTMPSMFRLSQGTLEFDITAQYTLCLSPALLPIRENMVPLVVPLLPLHGLNIHLACSMLCICASVRTETWNDGYGGNLSLVRAGRDHPKATLRRSTYPSSGPRSRSVAWAMER
ncbi:uncharacterized protein BDZ99DRAFT_514843 [Mytilinidion resinicola]|uniref:Uncharacterized protein n=1 Tax=Mytilinidion resinicola TaxID=574789 RepID=A0A6A6Z7L3_9PEZI|nr:uncharacterized protein BDZ99DRAFT_514843 [Mytilinidion resinicola]KAF2816245.1 hypothetical protein BDZ99DRAFT_514843 [Mytilinidion resinicola]